MSISKGHKANFKTLELACRNGDLALLECTDAATGAPVTVIVAVQQRGDQYEFVPLAKLFDGNPYDELTPPQ